MPTIVDLYLALKADPRLQKDWEKNQPRIDRALEAPLIVLTPREVATSALLTVKLRFEPAEAKSFIDAQPDDRLISFTKSQPRVGSRMAKILERETPADPIAYAAAVHTMRFYQNRSDENPLIRLPWSNEALRAVADANPENLINEALKPTTGLRAFECLTQLAALLTTDLREISEQSLYSKIRSIPGLGPERATAVGVSAFHQPWPIIDNYLWRLLADHRLITEEEARYKGNRRHRAFESHWQKLLAAGLDDPNEVAATLYLWADEANKFKYQYDL